MNSYLILGGVDLIDVVLEFHNPNFNSRAHRHCLSKFGGACAHGVCIQGCLHSWGILRSYLRVKTLKSNIMLK